MPAPSRTMLIASAIGATSLAFAGGFAASSATADPTPAAPIVNVDAWNETAPPAPVQIAAAVPSVQCSPWEVSDVAMEEVLREMQRRGWRPPNQGQAVESLASLGVYGIGAVDPDASLTASGERQSTITVLTDEEAEQLRTEQISLDTLIVDDAVLPPAN
jgi:hypothetical protein